MTAALSLKPYTYVTDVHQLGQIANEIASAPVVSLDLETTGFDPHTCRIRLLSVNTGRGIYVIDVFQTGAPAPVIEALRATPAVIVGQALKFDQKFLLHYWNLELARPFDTFRASALVYNGRFRNHNLWDLYRRELNIEPCVEDLGGSNWSGPLSTAQLDYAADDVIHLPQLRDRLRQKLIDLGLVGTAKIEFDAILPEAAMELNGIPFDSEAWTGVAVQNQMNRYDLQVELYKLLPHPKGQLSMFDDVGFNLDSPQQLLKSLQKLGVPVDATNEMTLAMQEDRFPVIEKILKYREYAQAVKSFGLEWLSNVHTTTGRVHPSFFPFTGAGRYACSKPNMQQIPRGKEFRGCFKAPSGRKLVIADYSQIELRIAAELAEDETLMGVYIRGEDAHAQTAALVSDVALEQVTKEQRQMAKAVNFGLIYGMAAEKLQLYAKSSYKVTMSLDEAETFRKRYFRSYSGVERWHRRIFSDVYRKRGVTRTVGGRLRYLGADTYNEWANTPVQGTGADGLKRSLRVVYERLRKYDGHVFPVHMVHDEIVLEAPDESEVLTAAQRDLEEGMIEGMQPFLKKVPVVVEGGVGPSWASK